MCDTAGRLIVLALVLCLRLGFRDIDQVQSAVWLAGRPSAYIKAYTALGIVSVFLAFAANAPGRTRLSKWIWGTVGIELSLAAARAWLVSTEA